MSAAEEAFAIGSVLVGKYRVESVLGQGGMGLVYRAQHLSLEEAVAIKVLRRDAALDRDAMQRFVREGRLAAKLKSQHVAKVMDVGTLEDGLPYMVMELLSGGDLGQMVGVNGPMHVPAAADLVLQACDAIAEAHSLGIVHRDIKPSNLFLAMRPDQSVAIKVLDFGISKTTSGADLSLTQTSSVLGTPAYMSPEQMRSARTVDARTDVWSLGTVLYELVEGRPPFQADSFSEMCVMVAIDPPAPNTLAPELRPIIEKCLAKRAEDRYATVAELMLDLAAFSSNQEVAREYITRVHRMLGLAVPAGRDSTPIPRPARHPASGPVRSMTAPAMSSASPPQTQDLVPERSRRGLVIALVALVVGLGGGIAILKSGSDDALPSAGGTPSPTTTPNQIPTPSPNPTTTPPPATTPTPATTSDPTTSPTTKPTTKPSSKPRTKPTTKANNVDQPKPPSDPFGSRTGCS